MKEFKTSARGTEITCVFYDVAHDVLRDTGHLKNVLLDALKQAHFRVLVESEYLFQPHGFTFVVILGESHAALHTYPEYCSMEFSLHSCRSSDDGIPVVHALRRAFQPSIHKMHLRKGEVPIAQRSTFQRDAH